MNFTRTIGPLLLLAAFGTHAQTPLTREQVKAELAEAIRTGDMPTSGESNLKLNEMYPGLYPAKPTRASKTRGQVTAELAEAVRTGDMQANGESVLKLNELNPDRYPARPVNAGKTREQVTAELAEAIRTGDMPASGETGQMLFELFPQRYAKARESVHAGNSQSPAASAIAANRSASAPTYTR